jgi:hypothetical protein
MGLVYTFASNADKTVASGTARTIAYFYGFLLVAACQRELPRADDDWLDRQFFREAYNQEKILLALVERLKSCESVAEISRLVCDRVQLALHPRVVHILTTAIPTSAISRSAIPPAAPQALSSRRTSQPSALMQQRSRVLELPTAHGTVLPPSEDEWFRTLGVTMLIAMKGAEERLCGLLLLGDRSPKRPTARTTANCCRRLPARRQSSGRTSGSRNACAVRQKIRRDVLAHVESRG